MNRQKERGSGDEPRVVQVNSSNQIIEVNSNVDLLEVTS